MQKKSALQHFPTTAPDSDPFTDGESRSTSTTRTIMIRPEAARSVIGRALPEPEPTPAHMVGTPTCSLVLFYQYVEPPWTEKEHSAALKAVIALGNKHGVKGRGRCAAQCRRAGRSRGPRRRGARRPREAPEEARDAAEALQEPRRVAPRAQAGEREARGGAAVVRGRWCSDDMR